MEVFVKISGKNSVDPNEQEKDDRSAHVPSMQDGWMTGEDFYM